MGGERNGLKGDVPFHPRRPTDVDGLPSPNNQGGKNYLYDELWHACAGPCVYVPRVGEKVLYFPQGHMEQVLYFCGCMHESKWENGNAHYNLPSKILCSVIHVHLKVEHCTDEVFAQITLLPDAEQDVQALERINYQSSPRKAYPQFFSKKLTPSDTSTHGGFSIPKRLADDGCLPLLDMSQQTPQQELVAIDLHGFEWRFRHIFRGQPKRHLLTSGWSTFLSSKKLVAGDTCIFLRGENEELRVGIRRATKVQNRASTSIISGHSMQLGILASAFHAFSTRSMFTVYHRPWSGSSEFIISFDQYMKSARIDYSVVTRFRMQLEGEECREKRASGTIVSNEDIDRIRWPNSEWRCLKVQWDPTAANLLPERVCPWNIEPMGFTKKKKLSILHNRKKARTDDSSSSMFSSLRTDGMWHGSINNESQCISGVLQGQEDSGNQSGALRQPIPHGLPLNHGWASIQQQMQNRREIQNPVCGTAIFSGEVASFGLHNSWLPKFSNDRVHEDALASRKFSVPNVNSQTSLCEPNGDHACMLFGVNLIVGQPEPPSPQHFTSSELESLFSIPPTSHSTVSEPSKGTSCSVSNRSCTKVLKCGTALGRSVDLTRFDGYKELIGELDRMFDFKGRLVNGSSGWNVTYTDDEGDMMMIGDHYPWQRFQYDVRRMLISPKEEMDRQIPSSLNSTSH
ncbi:Auxin response factor 4 [Hibiscus syriacus]|uniref:Auxin response factor n=1 Tax=Hibiscus syriacus TaxID=106335 RepID=A0A6A2ZKV5_HIBSY|nr:Auxin response factor 4 [Hibiscus syriacus]